ncbi:hypothetical protein [Virgibacillus salarius]
MRLLKQEEYSVEFLLGFVFAGQSYLIPQLILDFNDEEGSFIPHFVSTILNEQFIDDFPRELIKTLIDFLEYKDREYKLVYMPYETNRHFINIGHYGDKWYAATSHKRINMDFLAEDLLLPMLNEMMAESNYKKELRDKEVFTNLPLEYKDRVNMDADMFYFMYVKTAFNTLAFVKGTDFVCNEIFDKVREGIINSSGLETFIDSEKHLLDSNIEDYVKNFPEKAHYVILCAKENRLIAYVSFYGEFPGKVRITDEYQGQDFLEGLVCDWKERREMRLQNFL